MNQGPIAGSLEPIGQMVWILILFLFQTLWFILPAWFANASPAIVGGGPPIDGGRVLRDGNRLFGDGKTWRGLILGVAVGTLVGLGQALISPFLVTLGLFPFLIYEHSMILMAIRAFTLSFGALFGDLIGSFTKRRLGIPRGEVFWGVDQLGFLVVGFLLTCIIPLTLLYLPAILFLLPVTFAIHVITNLIWYALGQKETPF